MSRYTNRLAAIFMVTTSIFFCAQSHAGILFEDDFETGDLSTILNGIGWDRSNNVTTGTALSGTRAMSFFYPGVAFGQDGWAEKRIGLGGQYTELWIKYDLYIPSNYYHRRDPDGATNNKFFAIFNNGYRPGFQVNFSMYPGSNGGSNIAIHYYRNGQEQSYISDGTPIFTPVDFGKWHRIVMHFKVPSTLSSSDGVQQLWKNGDSVVNITNLRSNGTSGKNYMDEAYILGWSNSGFNENTTMYVDDVVISDTPISVSGAPGPTTPANIKFGGS